MEEQITKKRELTIEQMLVEIDKVKELWLSKGIKLVYLTGELEKVLKDFRQEKNYNLLKGYIETKILLDKNMENSNNILVNTGISLISILLAICSVSLNLSGRSGLAVAFSILSLFILIVAMILLSPVIKKYRGNYAKEKSFYEILLKVL